MKTGAAKEQRDWLVSLGTPNEDPLWTFKPIRNGAVQWVMKDGAMQA
jgi:hypothetical protein